MPRIELKPQARQDLIDIWLYVAEKSDEPGTADRFLDRIESKFEKLARQPRLGKARPDLRPGLRSFPVGRYLIFYLPLEDGIGVVRVLYGGRKLQDQDYSGE